jgi:transposase
MARTPSRFVELKDEDREALSFLRDHGETPRIRRRAQAILLSAGGKSVNELAEIFDVNRDTIGLWLDRWETEGITGLGDAARSGAPPKLTESELEEVLEILKRFPHSPKQVLREISERFGKTIASSTLRRIARRAKLRWKRMRRSLKSKPDEKQRELAREELTEFQQFHREGTFDLYYFDEAIVSLMPTVPYGWQAIGERLEIPSSRGGTLSVLGFLSLDSAFAPYTVEGTVDADVVVSCFDHFCESINRPTIVVIDNASPHTSAKFESRIGDWEEKGLVVYRLPPYCPELNLIEILWRMVKYHWIPLKAYESFASLVSHVSRVLAEVGSRHIINFAAATA